MSIAHDLEEPWLLAAEAKADLATRPRDQKVPSDGHRISIVPLDTEFSVEPRDLEPRDARLVARAPAEDEQCEDGGPHGAVPLTVTDQVICRVLAPGISPLGRRIMMMSFPVGSSR